VCAALRGHTARAPFLLAVISLAGVLFHVSSSCFCLCSWGCSDRAGPSAPPASQARDHYHWAASCPCRGLAAFQVGALGRSQRAVGARKMSSREPSVSTLGRQHFRRMDSVTQERDRATSHLQEGLTSGKSLGHRRGVKARERKGFGEPQGRASDGTMCLEANVSLGTSQGRDATLDWLCDLGQGTRTSLCVKQGSAGLS
jgi:hypothetical protein